MVPSSRASGPATGVRGSDDSRAPTTELRAQKRDAPRGDEREDALQDAVALGAQPDHRAVVFGRQAAKPPRVLVDVALRLPGHELVPARVGAGFDLADTHLGQRSLAYPAGMRTELLDPRTDARWEEFIGRAAGATMFHHPAWLALLAARYRYEFAASCVVDDGDRIVAGLPWARIESRLTGKRLVAVPFSDACPPLTDGASEEELARAVEEHRSETGLGLEVRWRMDALPGEAVKRYWRHTLPLEEDAAAVERRARSGIRRGAKKARKAGLTFEQRTDAGGLDAFYKLHLQTRKHQGVPTQAKRFIDGFGGLFEQGHGFVALVSDEGRPDRGGGLPQVARAPDLQVRRLRSLGALEAAQQPPLLRGDPVGLRGRLPGARLRPDGPRPRRPQRVQARLGHGRGARSTTPTPECPSLTPATRRVQRLLTPAIRHSPASVSRLIGVALYRHFG